MVKVVVVVFFIPARLTAAGNQAYARLKSGIVGFSFTFDALGGNSCRIEIGVLTILLASSPCFLSFFFFFFEKLYAGRYILVSCYSE